MSVHGKDNEILLEARFVRCVHVMFFFLFLRMRYNRDSHLERWKLEIRRLGNLSTALWNRPEHLERVILDAG